MLLVVGCGSSDDQPAAAATATATAPGGLATVEGRAVSGNSTQIVLRTADGERTFGIAPEDVQAVDPTHFVSHVGVPTLGFRIYYRSEGGVDYAVSAEEIAGSTLGFD
jgi:hypothetical protein